MEECKDSHEHGEEEAQADENSGGNGEIPREVDLLAEPGVAGLVQVVQFGDCHGFAAGGIKAERLVMDAS